LDVTASQLPVNRLVAGSNPGGDAKIIDWLDELTGDCLKKDCSQHDRSMRRKVSAIAEGVVAADR
jgi:hypothetical protein